jgi:hypothetical protein
VVIIEGIAYKILYAIKRGRKEIKNMVLKKRA